MADTKITGLQTPQVTTNPATDVLPIVNIADNSMAASGSTRKITVNQLLGAGGTATLASATITGDLTVATDRLKVNTGSTAVQIGSTTQTQFGTTAWPSDLISKANSRVLIGNLGNTILWNESSPAIGNASTLYIGAKTGAGATTFGGGYISAGTENASDRSGFFALSTFQSNGIDRERYRIDSTGVHTWQYVGGVSGTAMTLNSNGLGVGGSPAAKLHIFDSTPQISFTDTSNSNYRYSIQNAFSALRIFNNTTSTEVCRFDSSGNVGIGVTPSAWFNNYTALELTQGAAIWGAKNIPYMTSSANVYNDGNDRYKVSSALASKYLQTAGVHSWYTAASGTAGNAITWTQAMTLDASGNLLVGTTSGTFRGTFVVAGGADRDILAAGVTAVSDGFQVKWNHATTKINVIISNMPTSSAGLAAGTLWNDAGTIKIA